jgi:peptidoglycan/xylan/chitin deacetylase (PgdA/CDA1 family)
VTTILVYHRVQEDRGPRSVSPAALQAHLAFVERAGGAFVDPTDEWLTATARKQFLLTFDDGTCDHRRRVLDILGRHGVRALFFVPTQKIGTANRLSSSDVVELHRAGHAVGVHGHTHDRWDWLNESQLRSELAKSRSILEDLVGATPRHTAPPGGFFNPTIQNVVKELNFQSLRTMHWDLASGEDAYALRVLPMTRVAGAIFLHAAIYGRGAGLIRAAYRAKAGIRLRQSHPQATGAA